MKRIFKGFSLLLLVVAVLLPQAVYAGAVTHHQIRITATNQHGSQYQYITLTIMEPTTQTEAFAIRMIDNMLGDLVTEEAVAGWVDFFEAGNTAVDAIMAIVLNPAFVERDLTDEEFLQAMVETMFDRAFTEADMVHMATIEYWGRWTLINGFAATQEFINLATVAGITPGSLNYAARAPLFSLYIAELYQYLLGREVAPHEMLNWIAMWYPGGVLSASWMIETAIFGATEFQTLLAEWSDEEFVETMLLSTLWWRRQGFTLEDRPGVLEHHVALIEAADGDRIAIFESLFGLPEFVSVTQNVFGLTA